MPTTKTITIYKSDESIKQLKIRDFVPQRIQDQIERMSKDESIEKSIELNHFLLREMVIEPKITEETLKSDDCDSFENEQILIEIMMMAGLYLNPEDVIGKPKEEVQKLALKMRQDKVDLLKKKHPKPSV